MPNERDVPAAAPSGEGGATAPPERNLLKRLLEIKEWLGLGLTVVLALVSSGGWVLTYFAKKEEVDTLSCTMDVNVRLAKDTASIQLVRERQIQLRRDLRSARLGAKGGSSLPAEDDDEFASIDDLKAAIKAAKENLRILADDSAFFLNSLARKECDSREGRDKLRDRLRADPPLKGE